MLEEETKKLKSMWSMVDKDGNGISKAELEAAMA